MRRRFAPHVDDLADRSGAPRDPRVERPDHELEAPGLELLELGHLRVETAALLVHEDDVARRDAFRRRAPRRRLVGLWLDVDERALIHVRDARRRPGRIARWSRTRRRRAARRAHEAAVLRVPARAADLHDRRQWLLGDDVLAAPMVGPGRAATSTSRAGVDQRQPRRPRGPRMLRCGSLGVTALVSDSRATSSQTAPCNADVGGAVCPDARRCWCRSASSARPSAARKSLHARRHLVAEAEQRGGVREVEPVRRGDVLARTPRLRR